MSETEKTVFISYRRDVSSFIARAIFMDLRYNGYDVFMDVESIDSGAFDTVILNQIAARAHFILILTPGSLERCIEEGDWLRREIEAAMDLGRNIVPLIVNNFTFKGTETHLTGKLTQLPRYNALNVPHDYFDEAMNRLRTRFLKQPLNGMIIPTSTEEQKIAEQKIEAVATQQTPTKEELTAEQYFSRGFEKYAAGDIEGAIEEYTEATRINPRYVAAYNNRGIAYRKLEEYDKAISDHTEIILLNPKDAEAHYNRAVTRYYQGDHLEAIADYDVAIRLNPRDPDFYMNRSLAKGALGDPEGAKQDYTNYMVLKFPSPQRFMQRGYARWATGDTEGAIGDYSDAIRMDAAYIQAYDVRGWAKYQLMDFDGAIADYSQALAIDPTYADAYFHRGYVRSEMNDLHGAIADYTEVLRLNPSDNVAYCNRGEILFELGQYQQSLADFQAGYQLKPGYNYAIAGLAIASHMMGKVDDAKQLWKMLIDLDARYSDAVWVKQELNWVEPLVEEARKLILQLNT